MSIIEIACFRLESSELPVTSKPFLADIPYDKPTATLRFYLTHAIRSLSKNSKHPFHLLQDLEDNLTVYYIGKWDSTKAYAAFSASADRNELLDALKGCEAVMQWKALYDIVQYHNWESSVLSAFLHKDKGTMAAKLVGITRHNVSDVEEFEKKLAHGLPYMEKFSSYKAAAGRKIETDPDHEIAPAEGDVAKELQRDEIVILSGWESKEQYDDFRDSEDYQEFVQIRSVTTWFERVLGKPIKLE